MFGQTADERQWMRKPSHDSCHGDRRAPRVFENLTRAKRFLLLVAAVASLGSAGCAPVTAIGVKILYRRAALPEAQVRRDICYLAPGECAGDARTLDLYLPQGRDWPLILFVHGGGWDSGDKQLRVGGADVYANIGRFYAAHGIGVAVINYRLQPATDWRGQVRDVEKAARWAQANVSTFGGRPGALFLMGHSAGAHLGAYVALLRAGVDPLRVQGVISVSGAGLDLTDARTYELGEDVRYYERRFRGRDSTEGWKAAASPVRLVRAGAPPFLILYAGGEKAGLQRQAQVLKAALTHAGVENELLVVPGESHSRMVLTLSRDDRTSAPAVLRFIRAHS